MVMRAEVSCARGQQRDDSALTAVQVDEGAGVQCHAEGHAAPACCP